MDPKKQQQKGPRAEAEMETNSPQQIQQEVEQLVGIPDGITIMEKKQTANFNLVWGKITFGRKEVRISFIDLCSQEEPLFRPSRVVVDGKLVWDFKEEKKSFSGQSNIHKTGEVVVIFLDNHNGKIQKVIPVSDFVNRVTFKSGASEMTFGGYSVEQLLDLKLNLAKELKRTYFLTDEEKAIVNFRSEAKRIAEDLLRAQKAEERAKRREKILGRKKVTAYAPDGSPRSGIPVAEDEWAIVPNDNKVIIVNGYDDEKGEVIGEPLEACFVRKDGSRPRKAGGTKQLSWEMPKAEVQKYEARFVSAILEEDQAAKPMPHISDSVLKDLLAAGANTGMHVAVGEPTADGKITVARLVDGKSETIGQFVFTPLQQ